MGLPLYICRMLRREILKWFTIDLCCSDLVDRVFFLALPAIEVQAGGQAPVVTANMKRGGRLLFTKYHN